MNVLTLASVVPAIIPRSFSHLDETLHEIASFADAVQIDIVDGKFVPFTSWPYRGSGNIQLVQQYSETFDIEFDLMVERPEMFIESYARTGAKRIVIHLESVDDMEPILACKAEHGFVLGLSILNDTPLTKLTEHLSDADYVQLMGIAKIGSQGQPFDERVLERITELRAREPDLQISIDGSVTDTTLPKLKSAGATRFISGSYILSASEPEVAFHTLESLAL